MSVKDHMFFFSVKDMFLCGLYPQQSDPLNQGK